MGNIIPVVFCFDSRIIAGAAVAIQSLIDTAAIGTEYDIYVFHPDIGNKTIAAFEKLVAGSRHNITFKFVDQSRFAGAPVSRGSWREVVYYRILIPELLPQYDKVIYSDVDVLFKQDLSAVYATDLEGYDWGGVAAERNTPDAEGHKYFPENSKDFIFWSGFMLLNTRRMRQNNFVDICLQVISEIGDRLKFFDLDTINIASQSIKRLPFKYVTLQSLIRLDSLSAVPEYKFLKIIYSDAELLEAKNDPAIVHYAGKPGKPWHLKVPPEDWQKFFDKLPGELKRFTFRDWRKKLFNKNSFYEK